MNKNGIGLIILGLFVPSIFYPFTSLDSQGESLRMVSIINGGSGSLGFRDLQIVVSQRNDIVFEYTNVVAIGIVLFFIGLCIVMLYKNKKKNM